MATRRDIEESLSELVAALDEHIVLVEGSALALGGQEEYEGVVESLATLQQFFEEQL